MWVSIGFAFRTPRAVVIGRPFFGPERMRGTGGGGALQVFSTHPTLGQKKSVSSTPFLSIFFSFFVLLNYPPGTVLYIFSDAERLSLSDARPPLPSYFARHPS